MVGLFGPRSVLVTDRADIVSLNLIVLNIGTVTIFLEYKILDDFFIWKILSN